MLSADKSELIGNAFPENKQAFPVPPVLRELVRLLQIIGEEIVQYRIWPVGFFYSTFTSLAMRITHCRGHAGELLVLLLAHPTAS